MGSVPTTLYARPEAGQQKEETGGRAGGQTPRVGRERTREGGCRHGQSTIEEGGGEGVAYGAAWGGTASQYPYQDA